MQRPLFLVVVACPAPIEIPRKLSAQPEDRWDQALKTETSHVVQGVAHWSRVLRDRNIFSVASKYSFGDRRSMHFSPILKMYPPSDAVKKVSLDHSLDPLPVLRAHGIPHRD